MREIPEDTASVSLVTTILVMAHGLGLKSIAEGIETAEQQVLLKHLGCDYSQSYYFSKALRADGFQDYVIPNPDSIGRGRERREKDDKNIRIRGASVKLRVRERIQKQQRPSGIEEIPPVVAS
ncbi:MAG: EAL domain-containing protein, partial [Roseofilum sp. SBFL]|nr:EAL domain-containing protein [Roseofilum sp. SBFL]